MKIPLETSGLVILTGGISRYNGKTFENAAFDSLKITGDITGIAQIGDKIWFTSTHDGAILADFPVNDIRHIQVNSIQGKRWSE